MEDIIVGINIVLAIILVIVVLLQRSEGGGLGMGSDNQGFGTGTKPANPLSKLTWILTTLFFLIAILLTILSINSDSNTSVFEKSNSASESDGKALTPELPDLEKFKKSDGVLTPPSE